MARGTHVTFGAVFANGEFRALWAAEALSQIGDQLARVALAILVFTETGSAALTGLTYALTFAPSFLGGIFLSGLADRFPRRGVMVVTDVLRALLVALVAIPGVPFPVAFVLIAGMSFLQAPFKAAQQAMLPSVLPGDSYVVGMGIRTITVQTAHMIGFAGGGFLVTLLGPYLALGIDAATFLISAALVRFGVQNRPAATDKNNRRSMAASVGAGAGHIWRDRGARVLVLFCWLSAFLIVYEGLAAPYVSEIGGNTVAVGLLLAADPLGSVIGAFLFSRFVSAAARPKTLGPLAILAALPLLPCFLAPNLVVSFIMFAVAGALGTALLMQANAQFTRGVPDEIRAQAAGLMNSGIATVQGLSPLFAGLLADQLGTTKTVGIVGVIGLAIAIPAAIAWRRAMAADPDRWLHVADDE
ncbi:MAG TPA: MFS transporter [Actinophytocola sp.]|uniref:MFS transporter n=1 Tax=Actinophytocola sp. TaxID=1872138 RepID=UPI002DB9EA68|nr:MFS transporter [Actinophytocola sp.]HEU5471551.1 MFS transporter [Actinophytocola sp.]